MNAADPTNVPAAAAAGTNTLTVGSLFSGIGGLDLGLERAGMRVIWQSEIDPYACRVLAKHWPDVPNLGDITRIDWSSVERPDVICGGYPCQPFSLAGVRRGEADPRHLWPYFHRAIRHLRPRYALLENVPGHLSLGFDRVLGDLAEIGYDTEWFCLPAAAVGAPHLRWRLFAIAHPNQLEHEGSSSAVRWATTPDVRADSTGERRSQPGVTRTDVVGDGLQPAQLRADVPDAERDELRKQPVVISGRDGATLVGDDGSQGDVADAASDPWWFSDGDGQEDVADADDSRPQLRPTEPPGRAESQRVAGWWAVEPDVGRVAHGIPSRVDRLRCLGNAVVPQVAEWIGRRIVETDAA